MESILSTRPTSQSSTEANPFQPVLVALDGSGKLADDLSCMYAYCNGVSSEESISDVQEYGRVMDFVTSNREQVKRPYDLCY